MNLSLNKEQRRTTQEELEAHFKVSTLTIQEGEIMRKDAQENRQRIEELAHKLFSEEGVENISMNRIA
ncbi:hypothetical protein ACXQDM_14085, partial [Staphylococcus argenteus]